jgi:hypothetical protein
MRCSWLALAIALAIGCDGDGDGRDGGGSDMDGSTLRRDGQVVREDGSDPRRDAGCVPTFPQVCDDRIDQNCDRMDESCGDHDGDNVMICGSRDVDPSECDCDDTRDDVYPPRGASEGGNETCDGADNDCNGRIDEAAACCAGCAGLDDPLRGDICLESGACACTTNAGMAVCGAGLRCCEAGCVDTETSFDNCGSCGAQCTNQADRCTSGDCRCGANPVCDFINECVDGSCGG